MKTIVGLYMQKEEATRAAGVLESAGFSPASMRVLRSVSAIWHHLGCSPGRVLLTDFAIGAVLGIALYSLMGVIVAVGQEVLGFERSTAMGALSIFALAGVFVGGMLGFFFGLGNLEQESRLYIAGISRGGVLLVVRTADEHAERAIDVLHQTDAEGVKICLRTSDHPVSHGLPPAPDRLSLWSRWLARGLGIALLLLVLIFFVGEGLLGADMPDLLTMSLAEDFLLMALLTMLAGVVVAWRWESVGGMLIVGSVLLFEGINALGSGRWQFGVFDSLFLLVGLLFLLDWWHTAGGTGHPPAATSS